MIGALARVALDQLHALGTLDAPQPPDIGPIIQQLAQQFTSVMLSILTTIDSTVVAIARLAYITVFLLGILLHFTRVEKTGQRLD